MENINEIISEVKNSKILGSEDESIEVSLSEQRRQEAELRKYELTEDNPMISGEKYNGINAKIECDSYYTPDEAVKQCMIKYESQAYEAIKSVKVKRETSGQMLLTDKDLNDVKAQFPETKRNIAGNGPIKAMMVRRIKKWCGAICLFDVFESDIGFMGSRRKVYTVDNVKILFYKKNSDAISSEIILKNKFMRFRNRAGKSKDIK